MIGLRLGFTDKKIIVTGGTRGIGKAIATQFLKNGGIVTITGTKDVNVTNLKEEWGYENVQYKKVDFLKRDSVDDFLDWIRKQERIDILVNNAGINKVEFNVDSTTSNFEALFDVNLKGPYLLCREVSIIMKQNNYGKIANISSIWSSISRPGRSIYTATKSGLVGLTKTLAIELASQGILVNAVAPGFTMTELTKKTNTNKELEQLKSTIPIQRLAEPTEIAKLVLFLTSDLNTYLTGQNIIIDGGYTNI